MGLTGTCFLGNSDGSFDHSFCVHAGLAMEWVGFAYPGSRMAPLCFCSAVRSEFAPFSCLLT